MGDGFKCICSPIHLYQSPKPEELELRAGARRKRGGKRGVGTVKSVRGQVHRDSCKGVCFLKIMLAAMWRMEIY